MIPVHLILSNVSEKLPCGTSRFWGNPDLPSDYSFPEYVDEEGNKCNYNFLCQINLADVAPYDVNNILPHNGVLSFFAIMGSYIGDYNSATPIGGVVSNSNAVKVIYFPMSEGVREVKPDNGNAEFIVSNEIKIDFSLSKNDDSDEHALFAEPQFRQWDNWDHPYEDWQILLQVDSFEGDDFILNFMDVGVLDFLISPSDLKQHCFDNVRAIVLSS